MTGDVSTVAVCTSEERYCTVLFLLPIATFALVPGCFSITYLIAVMKDHVHPLLPMISETGEELPENFIFATIVNCGSFLASLTYIFRFMLLSQWVSVKPMAHRVKSIKWVNRVAVVVALVGVLGGLVVGNVEANRHHQLHYLGAGTVVVMQLVYCWLQCYLSHAAPLAPNGVTAARFALSALATAAFVAGAALMPWAYRVPKILESTIENNSTLLQTSRFIGYRWVSDQHRYFDYLVLYHCTEWTIVVCAGLFLLSFSNEFRKVAMQIPRFEFTTMPGRFDPSRRSASCVLAPLHSPGPELDNLSNSDKEHWRQTQPLPIVGAGAGCGCDQGIAAESDSDAAAHSLIMRERECM